MNEEKLMELWIQEESNAKLIGWDFSYLQGRYKEYDETLPWDYKELIKQHLKPTDTLLDIDTGGGEFLLSLEHPHQLTSACEAYLPNVEHCEKRLIPLGINFKANTSYKKLPFTESSFDIIINRHGDFDVNEIYRLLKPGGIFITQQIGHENDRDLVSMLLPNAQVGYEGYYLDGVVQSFEKLGCKILMNQEAYPPIEFYDVGALIWFAKIIEWEFVGFNVEACKDRLYQVNQIIKEKGKVQGTTHKFVVVIQKMEG